jgi:hypothetical protein
VQAPVPEHFSNSASRDTGPHRFSSGVMSERVNILATIGITLTEETGEGRENDARSSGKKHDSAIW